MRENGFAHAPEPLIYACGLLRFLPDPYLLIRTVGDPAALIGAVQRKLREIEPSRAVYEVRPLNDALPETLGRARFQSYLVMVFSLLALLLASLGLYGVTTYLIVQRTPEFGLRSTLGARPAQILTRILRTGLALGMAGGISGMLLSLPIALLIQNSFYGVRAFDLATYTVVALTLTIVCFFACLAPGIRAASIDPSRALRVE